MCMLANANLLPVAVLVPAVLVPPILKVPSCFYHSQLPFLLLPSPPNNSSHPPRHSVSLPYLTHYTPLSIAVLIFPIMRPLFPVLPLSSPEFFPRFVSCPRLVQLFEPSNNFFCGISVRTHQDLVMLFLWIFYIC